MFRLKTGVAWTAAVVVLISGAAREGAAGRFFDREPFRVMPELRLDTRRVNGGMAVRTGFDRERERISAGDAPSSPPGTQAGGMRSDLRIGSFRLYLSRSGGEGSNLELFPSGSDREGTLQMLRTLPGALRADPARTMVDSVGKLFEPQLNLGIEF